MIALMSAILVFSPQNSFQIAFKNLKGSWQIFPAICFQSFESKSLEKIRDLAFKNFFQRFPFKTLKANRWKKNCQRLDFKFLKANRWQNFESYEIAGKN